MLELVVSKPMPMAGVDVSEYKDLIQKAIDEGHTPCVMEYLHGKVQDTMGYDIGVCLNAENIIDFEKNNYKKPGIYDIKVIGYNKPCKVYCWNSQYHLSKALIVDSSNKEDNEFALRKYNLKAHCL